MRESVEREELRVDFLACPAEALLDDFVHRPTLVEADLIRAVSRHLARCQSCREEADRQRRGRDDSVTGRPWASAALALTVLALGAGLFLWHDVAGQPGHGILADRGRPDLRLAALARFEPPGDAALASIAAATLRVDGEGLAPAMGSEDLRELAAARESLDFGRYVDAARLLEDLTLRHPGRGGVRLLLAYALARSDEIDRAHRQYLIAEAQGAGEDACWGVVNTSLKVGDLSTARRELVSHLLERHPDDGPLRDLLLRLNAFQPREIR